MTATQLKTSPAPCHLGLEEQPELRTAARATYGRPSYARPENLSFAACSKERAKPQLRRERNQPKAEDWAKPWVDAGTS